jgi:AraC-like DNA-binding protein
MGLETEPRIPSLSLLPGMAPPEELYWHWRRAVSPYFDTIPLDDPRNPPQLPELKMFNADGFLFGDVKFSGQKFIRDSSWLRRNDDSDHVALQFLVSGRNQCENGGSDFVMESRGIYALNMGYEIDAQCSEAQVLSVILPRNRVNEDLPALADARGLMFDTGSTSGKLLAGFFHLLCDTLPTTTVRDVPVLSESLFGLLRALITAGDPISIEAQSGVLASVQRYIDRNLGDPALGIESICAHFRMSRATLYRILAPHGGVRDYIQRRRLMGVFRALAAPANMDRGVFDIALEFGFGTPSYFSHRFREHFGMSPSEAREAAQSHFLRGNQLFQGGEDEDLSDVETMLRWSKELGASSRNDIVAVS